jgi:hypothetical protein
MQFSQTPFGGDLFKYLGVDVRTLLIKVHF